jgi:hypothetical protein
MNLFIFIIFNSILILINEYFFSDKKNNSKINSIFRQFLFKKGVQFK